MKEIALIVIGIVIGYIIRAIEINIIGRKFIMRENKILHVSYHSPENKVLYFDNFKDAEDVLRALNKFIEDYGVATVGEYYDLTGRRSRYKDSLLGWRDLKDVKIKRTLDGYSIMLPAPIEITF